MNSTEISKHITNITTTKSGPHDIIKIIMDVSDNFAHCRMLISKFCRYALLVPSDTIYKQTNMPHITAGHFKPYNKFITKNIAQIDDNTDYIYSLIVLDKKDTEKYPYMLLYISNATLASMLHITYGFEVVTKEDEIFFIW